METTASLLSPTSSPSSIFSFSSMPSPRHSPASSSSCSPASSASCSFSFSPLPSPSSSSTKTFSAFPDLDISSNSSSIWNSQRILYASTSPQTGAFTRSRPPPLNVRSYAYSTTAEPSQKEQQKEHQQQQQQNYHQSQQRWSPLSPSTTSPRKTYYTILGVSPLATPKEIRNAYRKLALQYHPDVSPLHQLDTSTKIFAEINEAYSTLADPQKRACYDLKLALQSPSAPSPAPMESCVSSPSTPRKYTHAATGRVYPSMNSFYREWRRGGVSS